MRKTWGSGTMIIPAPNKVDETMKNVPEGNVITINEIPAALAKKHGARVSVNSYLVLA